MDGDQEFEGMLTPEEIDVEIAKVEDFFKRIPDELKAPAAVHLILEIVNQGSRDYFQAIGLFDEAKHSYRDSALVVGLMSDEQDLLSDAFESAKRFQCVKELKWGQGYTVTPGEIRQIGYVGEDDRYSGGERFEIFQEDGQHFGICKDSLEIYFEEMDNTD